MGKKYIDREQDPDYEKIEELVRTKTSEQLDREFEEWKKKFLIDHEQSADNYSEITQEDTTND